MRSDQEWMIEFWLFFDLCKRYRRKDVEQVYIAIQSALAHDVKRAFVGPLLKKIRPPGYMGLDDGFDPGIGATGLAFFHWLFDVELLREGQTNYHKYVFTRKHDKKSVDVDLKTEMNPREYSFQERYQEQLSKLKRSREDLLVKNRYGTLSEWLKP